MQGGACLATRANAHRVGEAVTGYARSAARIVSPRERYPSVSLSALGLNHHDSRHGGDERPSGQGPSMDKPLGKLKRHEPQGGCRTAWHPRLAPLLLCHCRAQQPIGLRPPRAAGTGRSSTSSKGSLALPWGAWPCPRSTPCARRSTQKSARGAREMPAPSTLLRPRQLQQASRIRPAVPGPAPAARGPTAACA